MIGNYIQTDILLRTWGRHCTISYRLLSDYKYDSHNVLSVLSLCEVRTSENPNSHKVDYCPYLFPESGLCNVPHYETDIVSLC